MNLLRNFSNPRTYAAYIVAQVVITGHSLAQYEKIIKHAPDFALVQELCYGSLRWFYYLNDIAQRLLYKPLKPKDFDIYALLLIGLYQLIYLNTSSHAALFETVAAAQDFKKPWAKGLINKILRRFLSEKESLLTLSYPLEAEFSHPQWFINALKKAWPSHWQAILNANNKRPPLTLRVNSQITSTESYLNLLEKNNLPANSVVNLTHAIILKEPVPVKNLPGFAQGFCSVQDISAQFAAYLMDLKPKLRVLDACAAPGSKTCHMLELEPSIQLLALDKEPNRLLKVAENLQRLRLDSEYVELKAFNANDVSQWWDGVFYDRILLDAPCSATGVIRRHPDIKLLRYAADIPEQAAQQKKLLNTLWKLLTPKGRLVYATCSVLPEENEHQIADFLQTHLDAKEVIVEIGGNRTVFGCQFFPEEKGGDGFYYAVLEKVS